MKLIGCQLPLFAPRSLLIACVSFRRRLCCRDLLSLSLRNTRPRCAWRKTGLHLKVCNSCCRPRKAFNIWNVKAHSLSPPLPMYFVWYCIVLYCIEMLSFFVKNITNVKKFIFFKAHVERNDTIVGRKITISLSDNQWCDYEHLRVDPEYSMLGYSMLWSYVRPVFSAVGLLPSSYPSRRLKSCSDFTYSNIWQQADLHCWHH